MDKKCKDAKEKTVPGNTERGREKENSADNKAKKGYQSSDRGKSARDAEKFRTYGYSKDEVVSSHGVFTKDDELLLNMTAVVPRNQPVSGHGEGQIHLEHSGGAKPRMYRHPHGYGNSIKDVERSTDGEKVVRTESDVMSAPKSICSFCKKKSSEDLKRCSRCLAVSYCDKECQAKDFAHHKLFCKLCDRYDIARARVWPALRFYRDLQNDRNFTVLLRDMPTEAQYGRGSWCNLLVEIVGQLHHFCKFSCLVTDLSGEKTRVIFHDPTNAYEHPVYKLPAPVMVPLETCLKPGNFLLLVGAHWRMFMDLMPGIRVNDLKSVYFIDMSDREIPKEYKKNPPILLEEDYLGRSPIFRSY